MSHADDLARRSSLLRFVPEAQQAAVLALFDRVEYAFGDEIVAEGDPADAWYIVVGGRARVLKRQSSGEEIMLGRLLPGDEFGEAALHAGGMRNATVRASTTVTALRLAHERFAELLRQQPALQQALELQSRWRTLHGFLYQFSDFGRLPASALQALMAALEPRHAARGELIVREGDRSADLMILRSGRAVAWRGAGAARQRLALYRAGDWFGERSLVTGQPRAASVEALDDCELLQLSADAARELCIRHPEFRQRLDERQALYQQPAATRVPLDFAAELLPAEASHGATDGAQEIGDDTPFAEGSLFRRGSARIRRFPFVAQIDEMDCGAACLAMVAQHYGREVTLTRLRALCHTSHDGTSLSGLCAAAAELGLAARALKVSPRHLGGCALGAHRASGTVVAGHGGNTRADGAAGPRRSD